MQRMSSVRISSVRQYSRLKKRCPENSCPKPPSPLLCLCIGHGNPSRHPVLAIVNALCKTGTDSENPRQVPSFFRIIHQSLNTGVWHVTNTDLLAHATKHSAHSLTHSTDKTSLSYPRLLLHVSSEPTSRSCAGPDQLRFTQPQENTPVVSSPAALRPHLPS